MVPHGQAIMEIGIACGVDAEQHPRDGVMAQRVEIDIGELSRDDVILRVWQAEGQPKPLRSTNDG